MPATGVTSCGVTSRITSEGITPPSSLLRTHAPVPNPPSASGFNLVQRVFAGCRQSLLGVGPSRRYLCESFPTCLDPYPGCSCGALTRFFPQDFGLPHVRNGSAQCIFPCKRLLTRTRFRGCSHSLMFRPAGLLATLAAPTMIDLSLSGSCGFYFRAEHASLPSRASDILTVRTGQLTVRDFHPIRFAALSAAPLTDRVSAASVKGGAGCAADAKRRPPLQTP